MCTSWVKGATREYSLTNHTGPPVLWSPIRLAHCLNYSQSKTIKSNYDQLWIIRMPGRLIAQRDGAASCHFQEAVTLIVPPQSLYLCPSMNAGWFQRMPVASTDFDDKDVSEWKKKKKKKDERSNFISLLLACPSAFSPPSLSNYGGSHWKVRTLGLSNEWPPLCSVLLPLPVQDGFSCCLTSLIVSHLPQNNLLFWQLGILVMWFAS